MKIIVIKSKEDLEKLLGGEGDSDIFIAQMTSEIAAHCLTRWSIQNIEKDKQITALPNSGEVRQSIMNTVSKFILDYSKAITTQEDGSKFDEPMDQEAADAASAELMADTIAFADQHITKVLAR